MPALLLAREFVQIVQRDDGQYVRYGILELLEGSNEEAVLGGWERLQKNVNLTDIEPLFDMALAGECLVSVIDGIGYVLEFADAARYSEIAYHSPEVSKCTNGVRLGDLLVHVNSQVKSPHLADGFQNP